MLVWDVAELPGQRLGQTRVAAQLSVLTAVARQQPHVARVVRAADDPAQPGVHGAWDRLVEEGRLVAPGLAQVVDDVEGHQGDGAGQDQRGHQPQDLHVQRVGQPALQQDYDEAHQPQERHGEDHDPLQQVPDVQPLPLHRQHVQQILQVVVQVRM